MVGTPFNRAKSTLVLMLLAAEAISGAPLEFHLHISGGYGQENIQLHFYKENATKTTENTSGISGTSSIFNGDNFSPDFQSHHTPQHNPQINHLGLHNSPFPNGDGFPTPGNNIFSNPTGPAQGQYPVGVPPQVARPGPAAIGAGGAGGAAGFGGYPAQGVGGGHKGQSGFFIKGWPKGA